MNRNSWELDEIDDGGRETSVQRLLTKRSRCDYTVSGVHESATGVVAFIAAVTGFCDGLMIFLDETFMKTLLNCGRGDVYACRTIQVCLFRGRI